MILLMILLIALSLTLSTPKEHEKGKTRSHDKPTISLQNRQPYIKFCKQIEETM